MSDDSLASIQSDFSAMTPQYTSTLQSQPQHKQTINKNKTYESITMQHGLHCNDNSDYWSQESGNNVSQKLQLVVKPKRKNPPKARNASLNSSLSSSLNPDDSEVVRSLVHDRYGQVLEEFRRRSTRRQRRNHQYAQYVNESDNDDYMSVSLPSIISSVDGNSAQQEDERVKLALKLLLAEQMEQTYDSQMFLRAALGSELDDTRFSSFASLSLGSGSSDDDAEMFSAEQLTKQLQVQEEIIHQTANALQFCKASKKFALSAEQIEAERILLIATVTKNAISEQLQKQAADDSNSKENNGSVKITKLVFPFRQLLLDDGNHKATATTNHFVCVLKCANRVQASRVQTALDGVLTIDKCFSFQRLPKLFSIAVEVYCLRSKNHTTRDKSLWKLTEKVPSPRKLFSHLSLSLNNNNKADRGLIQNRQSAFLLLGKTIIDSGNFRQQQFNLATQQRCTLLDETFHVAMETRVLLRTNQQGFLTVAHSAHACLIWNRRWCHLEGFTLKCWNYPTEERTAHELDLRRCVSKECAPAPRALCARQKTLFLQMHNDKEIVNYFLSCDTMQGMHEWQTQLTHVLKSLQEWNCLINN